MHIFATVIRDDDVYGTISLQTALFLLVKPLLLALLEEHLLDEVVADILLVCLLLACPYLLAWSLGFPYIFFPLPVLDPRIIA